MSTHEIKPGSPGITTLQLHIRAELYLRIAALCRGGETPNDKIEDLLVTGVLAEESSAEELRREAMVRLAQDIADDGPLLKGRPNENRSAG